jgi:hypothetical protein
MVSGVEVRRSVARGVRLKAFKFTYVTPQSKLCLGSWIIRYLTPSQICKECNGEINSKICVYIQLSIFVNVS